MLDAVAAGGMPVLRVYRWVPAAVSLGRFQAEGDVDLDACARLGVEVVRRPTGGKGLLHGGDLTYAVAMPRPGGRGRWGRRGVRGAGRRADRGVGAAGGDAAIARHDGPAGPVCFAGQQGADLRVGDRKLCGSAQVRHGGAVLQHGSILLRAAGRTTRPTCSVPRRPRPRPPGTHAAQLRAATVTLEELGAPTDAGVVADALVEGFATTLDLDFTSRVEPPSSGRRCTSRRRRGHARPWPGGVPSRPCDAASAATRTSSGPTSARRVAARCPTRTSPR